MGDLVRADISDCIEIDEETGGWRVDLNKAKAAGILPAIQELDFDSGGRPKVKMYDRKDALDKILRAHGAYRMRHEHSGPGGKDLGLFRLEIVNQPQDAAG